MVPIMHTVNIDHFVKEVQKMFLPDISLSMCEKPPLQNLFHICSTKLLIHAGLFDKDNTLLRVSAHTVLTFSALGTAFTVALFIFSKTLLNLPHYKGSTGYNDHLFLAIALLFTDSLPV